MLVRVVDYTIDDGRENPTSYRLFTTMLDPDEVTAVVLAAAYTERWGARPPRAGTDEDSSQQLTDDRGHPEAHRHLAERDGDEQKQPDLDQENQ